MIRRVAGTRRGVFGGLLAVALVALAVGVAQALAGTGTATSPILRYNDTCGGNNGKSAFGSVTFTKIDKTTLRTAIQLNGATPSMTYDAIIWNGACNDHLFLGSFKTGSDGSGNRSFTISTGGYESFFVFVEPHGQGVWGESVTVQVDG